MARYGALTDAAAAEGAKGANAPYEARLALARFLVGAELGYEAIGRAQRRRPPAGVDPGRS
jgi:hypothetical protein